MPLTSSDEFVKSLAPVFARLSIWNPKFGPVHARLRGASLQKITASDEGYVTLSVYRPGDDRTAVVLNIKKGESGLLLTHTKPKPQLQPNSFVQLARKHLVNRRIRFVYSSLEPVALFLEFEAPRGANIDAPPDHLILDLDSKPARVIIAKKYDEVPERYSASSQNWHSSAAFYESFCEWSLDATKTKRRQTFDAPMFTYCCLGTAIAGPAAKDSLEPRILPDYRNRLEFPAANSNLETHDFGEHEFGYEEKKAFEQKEMNFLKALSILPVHIRRACKSRLQFLERRLLRQRADLPLDSEISRLAKRAEGLRANLYLWPEKSHTWYVPQELIETFGLPTFIQLKLGQKPGDALDEAFRQIDKLKRRRTELAARLEDSKNEIEAFQKKVTDAGSSIEDEILKIAPEGQFSLRELGIYFSRIQPAAALALCRELEIPWSGTELKKSREQSAPKKWQTANSKSQGPARPPFRSFKASTGEMIHVARSAQEGDAMLKLMPSHHIWVHVLTGEGSHVWLEKPKKLDASAAAIREAAILAIHNSKLSRGKQGEVRLATRADIEKKKDLAPGKVLVRRCKTILVKYEAEDLEKIIRSQTKIELEN